MATPNQVEIVNTTNSVTVQNNNNQITVINEASNIEISLIQPALNVIQVATPGPQGTAGATGSPGTGSFETGSFATTGSNNFNGNQIITGSTTSTLGFTGSLFGTSSWANNSISSSFINNLNQSVVITGSTQGNVTALTISSNTASLNLNSGNFFTLQLVAGVNTHINPSNIKPGQSSILLLSTTGSATVSFPSTVKQPSGSSYTPTTTTSTDILTFVSLDNSNLYLVSVKNLI